MERKQKRGSGPSLVGILVLVLLVSALLVTPLTMSKYAASGNVAAQARVAAFDAAWAIVEAASNSPGNPGDKRGLFLHPKTNNSIDENLTKDHHITWKCTNNSEVLVEGQVLPKQAVAPAAVNTNGANSTGLYANNPSSRADLTSARITVNGGPSGAFGGGGVVTASAAPLPIAIGQSAELFYTIKGYNSVPAKPGIASPTSTAEETGSFAGSFPGSVIPYVTYTTLNNQTQVIQVGVGGGANVYPWFRTYRVNTDGVVTQID